MLHHTQQIYRQSKAVIYTTCNFYSTIDFKEYNDGPVSNTRRLRPLVRLASKFVFLSKKIVTKNQKKKKFKSQVRDVRVRDVRFFTFVRNVRVRDVLVRDVRVRNIEVRSVRIPYLHMVLFYIDKYFIKYRCSPQIWWFVSSL